MGSRVSRPSKADNRTGPNRCHRNKRHSHVIYENYTYSPRHREEPLHGYHDHSHKIARATPHSRRARRDFEVPISPNAAVYGSRVDYADRGGAQEVCRVKYSRSRKQRVDKINRERRREWELYKKHQVQTIGGRFYF